MRLIILTLTLWLLSGILLHQEDRAHNSPSQPVRFPSLAISPCTVLVWFSTPCLLRLYCYTQTSLPSYRTSILTIMTATEVRESANFMAELPACQCRTWMTCSFPHWLTFGWVGKVVLQWAGTIEEIKMSVLTELLLDTNQQL